jgi:hypothetical protein
MTNAQFFRDKAAQCRSLVAAALNKNDPAVLGLLALAAEFDAAAVAIDAGDAAARQQEPGAS